jgi:hypothetical protein
MCTTGYAPCVSALTHKHILVIGHSDTLALLVCQHGGAGLGGLPMATNGWRVLRQWPLVGPACVPLMLPHITGVCVASHATPPPPPQKKPLTPTRYMRKHVPVALEALRRATGRAAMPKLVRRAAQALHLPCWRISLLPGSTCVSFVRYSHLHQLAGGNQANDSSCMCLTHHPRPCRRELASRPHTHNVTARHSRVQPASGQRNACQHNINGLATQLIVH